MVFQIVNHTISRTLVGLDGKVIASKEGFANYTEAWSWIKTTVADKFNCSIEQVDWNEYRHCITANGEPVAYLTPC